VAVVPSETQPAAADPIVFRTGGPGENAIADPPIPDDAATTGDGCVQAAKSCHDRTGIVGQR